MPAHKRAKKPDVLSQPTEGVPEGSPGHDSLFSDSESNDEPLVQRVEATDKKANEAVAPSRPVQTSSPGSPSLEKLPKTSIPAHIERRLNPRVKPMTMKELNIGNFQPISTKARITGQSPTATQKQKSFPIDADSSRLKDNSTIRQVI